MTKRKGLIYAILFIVALIVLWFVRRHADNHVDAGISSVSLPPQDEEKLIINQYSHTITDIKRGAHGQTETKTQFIGPHTSIEFLQHGGTKVSTRSWGTEINPSIGILYGNDFTLRAEGTLSLFYIQRFEFGIGMGMGSHTNSARSLIAITYNAYGNVIVGAYVDNHHDAGVVVGLRFR